MRNDNVIILVFEDTDDGLSINSCIEKTSCFYVSLTPGRFSEYFNPKTFLIFIIMFVHNPTHNTYYPIILLFINNPEKLDISKISI